MPQFIYKAKDQQGSPVEGVIEAEARAAVISRLQAMGYFPLSIEQGQRKGGKVVPVKAATASRTSTLLPKLTSGSRVSQQVPRLSGTVARPGTKKKDEAKPKAQAPAEREGFSFGRHRIKTSDLASFNRQLADLLGAGVPLVKSLAILCKQTPNERLREVVSEINGDVQGGDTFADALAKHPRIFSKLYVAMVRSGEAGGMLDEVLKRLADFSEAEEQLKGSIKSALAYPVVMIIAGSGAIFVMFYFVVPKIVGTFVEMNQALPGPTQLLITVSNAIENYWYVFLGAMFGLVMLIWKFINTAEGQALWHRSQLRIPLLGDLIQKREVARFARTLGSLLRNGVPILMALNITRDVLNNLVVKKEVDKVIEEITQGAGIATPLRDSQVFPPVTVNMMSVGEETGQLESVLLRISDSYELEVDRRVKTLTSLIEPIIIAAMGVVVGFIVISMLLPIFSLDPSAGAP